MHLPSLALLASALVYAADPTPLVRGKLAAGDIPSAEAILEDQLRESGETAEYWKAASWVARGALYQKEFSTAKKWAEIALHGAEKALAGQSFDKNPDLEIAIGASLEVLGQIEAAKGNRKGAIEFFRMHLGFYKGAAIEKRLQKNMNLVRLTGAPAPPIDGQVPKSALIFLWAHYCGDCKAQAPVVIRAAEHFKSRGLQLIAPTQLYGSVDGKDAAPAEERAFIENTWTETYRGSASIPHPVDESAMLAYGASTTPALVLTDANGIVRWFRAGRITERQLQEEISKALGGR